MKTSPLDSMTLAYHELRSPLGLVATSARSAAEEADDSDVRRRCETIVRVAERMLRTAEQVFRLNELADDEGRAPYSPSDVALAVIEDLRALDVDVVCEISPVARRVWAMGVAGRFEALLQSLLTNAVDHGAPGEPIALCLTDDGAVLQVRIANTIAAEKRHKGLGLGSVIANQLALQLGADLEMAAEGDTFRATIRLPL